MSKSPAKRGGCVRTVFNVIAAMILLAIVLAIFGPRRPAVQDAPAPAPAAVSPPARTAPSDRFKPGDQVEVLEGVLAATEEIFDARARGESVERGKDIFGTAPGTSATVVAAHADRVRVKLAFDSNWPDRMGWIAPEKLRLRPNTEELAKTDARGLTEGKRREIYQAMYAIGMEATREAQRQFPSKEMPTEAAEIRDFLARQKRVYDRLKKEGRAKMVRNFHVDGGQLDAIDKEGTDKRWPLE